LRTKVREHSEGLKTGDRAALHHWRDLANLLLHVTVADASANLRLTLPNDKLAEDHRAVLHGFGERALLLRDGRFLRVFQVLSIEATDQGPRVKVQSSSYQYQTDKAGTDWLFRFDYERNPRNQYPGAHLQINAEPCAAGWLPSKKRLGRVHFPTRRTSLEAVLRLLIEDFGVRASRRENVWRAVLAASEGAFHEIAHPPSPGPSS
jgi:hypothetical protein